ncbi:MAG: M20/M25/M40 family metallo-hydrolase [Planctomycetes bacterium]|nr:M20/M25/M40 family metallo-hydrolase [Planctomycetota bacterium]
MDGHEPIPDVRDLLERLVTTPGPTGGEAPRLAAIRQWAQQAGVPARSDAAGNVWLDVGGEGPWAESILLDAHVDVVGAGVAERLVEQDGRLVGAGVADDLAAVALLAVFARHARDGGIRLRRPLRIVLTVGEEGLGNLRGIRQVADDHADAPFALVSLDGSRHKCHVAGLGSNRYRLVARGEGGHSWSAWGTPSATQTVVDALARIRRIRRHVARQFDRLVSFNIGTLAGGEGINCISRHGEATFEFRSESPDALREIDVGVCGVVHRMSAASSIALDLEIVGLRPAADPVDDGTLLGAVRRVWQRHAVEVAPSVASTNINVPLTRGWRAICVGIVEGGNGHRADEYIETGSLPTGWAMLNDLVAELDAL